MSLLKIVRRDPIEKFRVACRRRFFYFFSLSCFYFFFFFFVFVTQVYNITQLIESQQIFIVIDFECMKKSGIAF